jgi:hypothetical protein
MDKEKSCGIGCQLGVGKYESMKPGNGQTYINNRGLFENGSE